ncbi:hypothetical protein CP973_29895 [Streptomyces albofaciens JCM 4342]|uniref:hypothetical protein n=1 Tax=Streptomyces albofaciens TaxID=66866 RepID=UPI00123A0B26|nr:hypothetical protein [Streptomyces albofaciens]KAA6213445.1 hypothetical protein CP973_29895 [Streptomyces albofaciens JCM 4342]
MSYALAAAVALSGVLFTGAATEAAAATARPQAQPSGPPFPYADCIREVKRQYKGKKDPKATCDALVRKGYIKKPGT